MADDLIVTETDAIATYPFEEIKDGQGIVTYNLYSNKNSSGTSYRIGKETVHSRDISIMETAIGTHTYTFDSGTFSMPRVVDGTAVAAFHAAAFLSAGGPTHLVVNLKFYHYDGSTETQMGNTWTSETLASNGAVQEESMIAIVSLPTTKFRAGDILRVKVEMVISTNPADLTEIGIDPENRDGEKLTPSTDGTSTTFRILIPYRNNQ